LILIRDRSRIFGKGGLIQGTKLLGGDVFQHAKHAGTRGSGACPPGKFFKIDAKILQFRNFFTYIKCFYSACRYYIMLVQHVLMERFLSAQTTT